MQPVPKQFDMVLGDMNFYSLTASQKELLEEAKNLYKDKVREGNFEYSAKDLEGEGNFMHHIEVKTSQKLNNGIVFKLVRYDDNEPVLYTVSHNILN
jgi:hypothetical protein